MKLVIPKLEYDVVEHCNLNCHACIHSSQFKTKKEESLEFAVNDLKCLFDRFDVQALTLKGGEPTLHSNLPGLLMGVKKVIGKDTKFSMVTNGLRIPTMSPAFFTAARITNITLCLSIYPTGADYEKITNTLKESGIPYSTRSMQTFYDFIDPKGEQDAASSLKECRGCGVDFYPLYYDRYLYLCCYVLDVPFLNDKFKYNIPQDRISIYESDEKIEKYLGNPCETCKFCTGMKRPIKWRRYEQK